MRARGTRTLTMALLLLAPALLFAFAELSWLVGTRAAASTLPPSRGMLGVSGAELAGGVVCPMITLLLGLRLVRGGHRLVGRILAIAAPLVMLVVALGALH